MFLPPSNLFLVGGECDDDKLFNRLAPGIFVEGGQARNVALRLISGVLNPPPTLDIDFLTAYKSRIYTANGSAPIESRRILPQNMNFWKSLYKCLTTIRC